MPRHRSISHSFETNIEAERAKLEALALTAPDGAVRDALLRKIRHLAAAAQMSEWLKSPGLRPPE
jgi:hypothetical protein